MLLITIRQTPSSSSDFAATVRFDRQGGYPITLTPPFGEAEERELEWYFEGWVRFPFTEKVKADRARQSLMRYGQTLFDQVFRANGDVYAQYRDLRQRLSQVQIEIESLTPEFQALHWEAMVDVDVQKHLAIECVMVRKAVKPAPTRALVNPSPVINLLLVTARPDEESDVGYRTISRPLVEAIETSQLRVNIDLLRPGTYEALSRQLEGKEGHYHIVHFDLHGAVLTYDQLQTGMQANRYLYQARYGRDDIAPYYGLRGYVFFEGESKGKADPVEASELANLLTGKGIPVCVLNACQSGKQVVQAEASDADPLTTPDADWRETSLGSRLMQAGMQMVVAMGYSVTVSAAQLLMQTLYGELFSERGITEALRLGRKELYNRKNRRAYFNQQIELEDWVLPVVYVNQTVDLKLTGFATSQEEEAYYERRSQHYRFGGATYGFVGRDLEILKLEKRLLQHNVLLLRGMGGTGKTTLLSYLREWWQTTRFITEAFYFGYDERAYTLEQMLFAIGQRVYDRFEWGKVQAMSVAAQTQKLVAHLKAHRYALMLDNLESVTGQALSIPNTLNPDQQRAIEGFLRQLVGGKTLVLLGSRSGEEWLQQCFRHNIYDLKGLDPESRSVLAEKILNQQIGQPDLIQQIRQDPDFERLMHLLAGYPLAMEVVLANLTQQTPAEILAALQAADVKLNVCGADRTNNILKCVEYSHSNLSEAAQQLLVCLAPFNSFIDRADLENYGNQLQQLEPFAHYPFAQFDSAIEEAVRWGLFSPIYPQEPRLLQIQPVFPFFLRTKLSQWDAPIRAALDQGFRQHYRALAEQYKQLMDSKDPQERQLGIFFCKLEYENLYRALTLCLIHQEDISIFFCLYNYFGLIQDVASGLKLAVEINQALENYSTQTLEESHIVQQVGLALERLAYSYQKSKQYELAEITYQKNIQIYRNLKDADESQKQQLIATIYHQLGNNALKLHEFEAARDYYQQALQIKIEFGDRYGQAGTYHQLGMVAQEVRKFEVARDYYQQALQIYIEFGDRYEQASTLHQLGMVEQEVREFEAARDYYQQALQIKIEFGDRFSQASTYGQLGILTQELRKYEAARDYYQKALQLFIEFGDRYEQARTYHQLGMVAQEVREFDAARDYYQQALQIYVEFGDRYSRARTYSLLGLLAEVEGKPEEAKPYHLQALQIAIEFKDEARQAFVFQDLGRIYRATQDEGLLTEVAQLFSVTVDEVRQAMLAE